MATITLPAVQVIAAAEKQIARIYSIRKERDEKAIASLMKPRKFLWFNLKQRTREEAVQVLEPSEYTRGDLIRLKKLLKLAQNGDPVTLDHDDTNVLF
jgi:hypothetical protein